MIVSVDNLGAALLAVEKVRERFTDFRPLWMRLQSGPLPELMRARWDARFDLGLRHADSTIEDRRARTEDTYYGDHSPGPRASADAPYYEWTGALRGAVSSFASVDRLRAVVDPTVTYRGPLGSDGWNQTGARFLADRDVFPLADTENMVEHAMQDWVADEVAKL